MQPAMLRAVGRNRHAAIQEDNAGDEIVVRIAPVLLGDGVQFFGHPGATPVNLETLVTTGVPFGRRFGEDALLSGALIVDPLGGGVPPPDRVFVINHWADSLDAGGFP